MNLLYKNENASNKSLSVRGIKFCSYLQEQIMCERRMNLQILKEGCKKMESPKLHKSICSSSLSKSAWKDNQTCACKTGHCLSFVIIL